MFQSQLHRNRADKSEGIAYGHCSGLAAWLCVSPAATSLLHVLTRKEVLHALPEKKSLESHAVATESGLGLGIHENTCWWLNSAAKPPSYSLSFLPKCIDHDSITTSDLHVPVLGNTQYLQLQ